jgi:hypothetical protein
MIMLSLITSFRIKAAERRVEIAQQALEQAKTRVPEAEAEERRNEEYAKHVETWDYYDIREARAYLDAVAHINRTRGIANAAHAAVNRREMELDIALVQLIELIDERTLISRARNPVELFKTTVKNRPILISLALDIFNVYTGGITAALLWHSAKAVEAGLRCQCGECICRQLFPFGAGELLFGGRCVRCYEKHSCSVGVTSSVELIAAGLQIGQVVGLLPSRT